MLPEQSALRLTVEVSARKILEAAGYRRIETPTFEDTDLFRRTVGESTDIVQKEMYTLQDGGGRSLTLRPEVTAPIVRAYLEHGMHKLPQPVKLWYLSSCFRYERAQAGRYRQFWQIGAEAIGSDDPAVDAESILLLAAILDELGVRGVRLRLASLGTPASRARYRELLQAHLRAHEDRLAEDVAERIDLNPLRAFDSDHPGTREVMQTAPLLLDHLDADDVEHFAAVRELLDAAEIAVRDRPDARARPGLLHAHGLRVHLGRARRAERRRRRRALRRRSPSSSAAPRRPGWAGRPASSGSCSPPRSARCPSRSATCSSRSRATPRAHRTAAFTLAAEARRAGVPTQLELAGRSLKGQLKQAARLRARYVAILGDEGIELKDMESGEQTAVESASAVVATVLRGRFIA